MNRFLVGIKDVSFLHDPRPQLTAAFKIDGIVAPLAMSLYGVYRHAVTTDLLRMQRKSTTR